MGHHRRTAALFGPTSASRRDGPALLVESEDFRSESIFRCSRIPRRPSSGSTSAERPAPTAAEAVAAAPIPAGVPRVPSPPDHFGPPDLASRDSGSSPTRRRCPSSDSTDRPGTSGCWALAGAPPGPRDRSHRSVRRPIKPTRHPPTGSQTAEPKVSFALRSPSPKDFAWTAIRASTEPHSCVRPTTSNAGDAGGAVVACLRHPSQEYRQGRAARRHQTRLQRSRERRRARVAFHADPVAIFIATRGTNSTTLRIASPDHEVSAESASACDSSPKWPTS